MKISLPFLKESRGLGDLVSDAARSVGIQPCGGCKQRAMKLNQALQFVPPTAPLPANILVRFTNETKEISVIGTGTEYVVVWNDGRERHASHTEAMDHFKQLCRR